MQEVYEFIKECGTYYLATVDGDQARVRPFGTIHIFEDKLYIQTGKVKISKGLTAVSAATALKANANAMRESGVSVKTESASA